MTEEYEKEAQRLRQSRDEALAAMDQMKVHATVIFNQFPPSPAVIWTIPALRLALYKQLWGTIEDLSFDEVIYTDDWGNRTYRHRATFTLEGETQYVHRIDHRYTGFIYTGLPCKGSP